MVELEEYDTIFLPRVLLDITEHQELGLREHLLYLVAHLDDVPVFDFGHVVLYRPDEHQFLISMLSVQGMCVLQILPHYVLYLRNDIALYAPIECLK